MSADQSDSEVEEQPFQALAERLRIVRDKANVKNDYEFARLAGVARSSMSLYLNGKHRPKPATLHKLAHATGTDIDWLLGNDLPSQAAEPADHAAIKDCALLNAGMLDSPVNFSLLLLSVSACQDHYKAKAKPTLKAVLDWIAGPYALHASIAEMDIKLVPAKESAS